MKKAIVSGDCNSVPTRAITKGEQMKKNDFSEAAIWSLWVPAQLARIEQQTGDLITSKLSILRPGLKQDQVLYLSYSIKFIYQEAHKMSRKSGPCNFFSILTVFISSLLYIGVKFSSVAQSCTTLCDPMDCSTPGFPVHHQTLPLSWWCHPTISSSVSPFSSSL